MVSQLGRNRWVGVRVVRVHSTVVWEGVQMIGSSWWGAGRSEERAINNRYKVPRGQQGGGGKDEGI